ncbi:MAG: Rrf2 family transcriptional regulator [Saprospiraceae bacterium]|nr:Rrf2 family transcriptional regulator [Saprospiraceae bacterium]
MSTKAIAEVMDMLKPTLVKILQSLSMARIIQTKEGKQGGTRLSKSPNDLTILDILNAVECGKPLF